MFTIGVSTACYFGTAVVEDAVEEIARLGARDVEVFLNTFCEYEEDFVRELRRHIDDHGMRVHSVHPHGVQFEPNLFSPYARTVEDCMKLYRKVLAAAQILGAKNYIFHGGLFFKPSVKNRLNFARVGKTVSILADTAAEYGIRLAYENVHWCWFSYPDFAARLLEHVQSKNLYFNFDIKQAAQSGAAPLDYLEAMRGRLVSVHICDYRHIDRYFMPCKPFSGDMDFAALRDKLEEMAYDGPMILELYSGNYSGSDDLKAIYERFSSFMNRSA